MIRTLLVCLAFFVASVAVTAWYWPALPDPMPVHWGVDGAPDSWMSRSWGALTTPVVMLVALGIGSGITRFDSRKENVAKNRPVTHLILTSIAAAGFGLHWLTLQACLSPDQSLVDKGVLGLLGLLLLVLGNALPQLRSNRFVGIRTPWTLESDKVWHVTHRVGGWTVALGGLVTLVAVFTTSGSTMVSTSLGAVLVSVLIPVVYSYLAWRRFHETGA